MRLGMLSIAITFMAMSISLALISGYIHMELIDSEVIEMRVVHGTKVLPMDRTGFVVVKGTVAHEVRVYLLTYPDYVRYERDGILPREFVHSGREEVSAYNPKFIMVVSESPEEITITMMLNVYSVGRPYASLSILSYLTTTLAIGVLFTMLRRGLNKGRGLGS